MTKLINEKILYLTYFFNPKNYERDCFKYVYKRFCIQTPFDIYFYRPLRKIFKKVVLYDYLLRRRQIGIVAMNEEVIRLVKREKPKYVLWTSFHYDIFKSTFEAIRKEGIAIIGWFFDDDWRFENYSKQWVPYLDYCVTNLTSVVPKYHKLGVSAIQIIPNTGIAVGDKWPNKKKEYSVSFVGTQGYADRKQYAEFLNRAKIRIHYFGTGWNHYVPFKEMIRIIQASKINLSFSKTADGRSLQIKGRVFQVCLAGGFVLTEYAPGIEKYFEIDKEIVCFHNSAELVEKIRYYLTHEPEREKIAERGWLKATNKYTSDMMISEVFKKIAAKPPYPKRYPIEYPSMPPETKEFEANYHFDWGRSFEDTGNYDLSRESYLLALKENPSRSEYRYYYFFGFLPSPIRSQAIRLIYIYHKIIRLTPPFWRIAWYYSIKTRLLRKVGGKITNPFARLISSTVK